MRKFKIVGDNLATNRFRNFIYSKKKSILKDIKNNKVPSRKIIF